jgi:hypothetical protein
VKSRKLRPYPARPYLFCAHCKQVRSASYKNSLYELLDFIPYTVFPQMPKCFSEVPCPPSPCKIPRCQKPTEGMHVLCFFCFWAQNATNSDNVKHAFVFDPVAHQQVTAQAHVFKFSCSQNSNSLPDMTSSLPDQHQEVDRICVLIHPTGYRRARTLRSIKSLLLGLQACVLLSTVSFFSEPLPALSVCPRFGHF